MASALPHLLFCSFLIPLLSAITQTYSNVSLGTSLYALDNLSSWISPSGDFAFGFRRLPGDGDPFVLAIWFAKVPNKTIVWTAKNGYRVPKESKAELTINGELVLKSFGGSVYSDAWTTIGNMEAAYGAMLDTGNFVIASKNSIYIWESFNYPTDTILPTQVLRVGGQLSSRGSENDYSIGRFELRLLDNGSLVLNQMDFLTKYPYAAYYVSNTSGANPNESGYQVVFNESGYIYIQIKNGSISNLTPANIVPSTEFYYRATLHFDGVFIQYSHPKTSHGNETWSRVWSIPDNICVATYSIYGSGPCGFNSYCELGQDMRPSCGCPPGFSPFDPNDQFSGCKQQYVQECNQGRWNVSDDQFEFREVPNADWPLTAYEQLSPCSEYECRRSCLTDCFCVVAIFNGTKEGGGSCWKKKLPLSNGKLDKGVDRIALFKVLKPNASLRNPPHSEPVIKTNKEATLILSILLGGSALFNFLFVAAISLIVFYMYHTKLLTLRQVTSTLETNLQSFTYKDLEEATDGFKEELGRGAFGIVYKGLLPSGFRNHVAVKKLDKMVQEGEKEFKTEVSVISQTHHKNLVRLLGFCDEGEHRLLKEEEAILMDWACDCYKDGRLGKLVEDDEEARSNMKMVEKLVMVAIWCIQDEPSLRPSMKKVTLMLEGVVECYRNVLMSSTIAWISQFDSDADPFRKSVTSFESGFDDNAIPPIVPCFLYCSLLLLLLSDVAQTYSNVSLGASLYALDDNSSWISPSGDFAFGFRRLAGEDDPFVLAIWFAKTPSKTIVWTANNGYRVPADSKVELTTTGELVLKPFGGSVYLDAWKTENFGTMEAAYGAMLDTGNFVIASKNSSYIWESFNYPTDTILPTQVLGVGGKLSSRGSENDYSIGRFELRLLDNGSLVLNQMDFLTKYPYAAYYVSNTSEANQNESGNQVVFNESGYIYIQMKNGSISNLTPANIVPSTEFYYRATLQFDGVFIQYSHPKTSHGNETWSRVWSIPDNICVASHSTYGSGPCGYNSYCKLGQDMRPSCGCPPGFSPFDPNDQFSGCKQQYVQECKQGRWNAMEDQFEFKEIPNADWPITAYERLTPCSEYECKRSCLSDCFCVVAIFTGPKDGGGSCWKKKLPLSNGMLDKGVDRIALFKVLKPNASLQNPSHSESATEKNNGAILILAILLGSSALFNFLFVATISLIVFYMYHTKLLTLRQVPSTLETNLQSFTYKDLEEATDGFKEELGRGAFGIVYKGLLPPGSRNHVAVKKLDKVVQEGEKEFKTEVSVISQTHHKNLVRLLGFCDEGEHRLLNEEEAILVDWAYDCFRDGRLGKLVEGDEEAIGSGMKMVEKLVMVAIWCIQDEPSLRPSMKKVTLMLEGVVEVSVPPCPFFFNSIS
ncbi:hypothetical protein HHK36_017693 [Tetracentron sinense]|uniref:non-specific serine/threonine protein kinase n=1 Tax=Tetracentron sinense TaxID=13715 RepID=A0A834Z2G4_TETSI|nr:hypothetical protein HHK36_017693 [Tetracentron sinense]